MQGFPGYISPMNSAKIPTPLNEPVLSYAPGTRERTELKQALQDLSGRQIDIPIVIGGKEIRTGRTVDTVMPHDHGHILARCTRPVLKKFKQRSPEREKHGMTGHAAA